MQRRRFKKSETLEERLVQQAAKFREQARIAAPGIDRERFIRAARQAETVSRMTAWLNSNELRPPTQQTIGSMK
jgi:hypothetical protein